MFYSVDLLCRKKRGKFSLIWLAAMGRIKKIPRAEISQVNILHVCEELITVINTESNVPTRRFSLYLSAQLVYGTIICYREQVTIFMNDLFTLYTRKTELVQRIRTLRDDPIEGPPKKKRKTVTRKTRTRPEDATVPDPDARQEIIEEAVQDQDINADLIQLHLNNENIAPEGEITLREVNIPPSSIQRADYDPFGDELLEIGDPPVERPSKKKSTKEKRSAEDNLSSISKRRKNVPPPLEPKATIIEHGVVSPITPVVRRMLLDEQLRHAEQEIHPLEHILQTTLGMELPVETDPQIREMEMSQRRDVSQPIVDEMPQIIPGDVPQPEVMVERVEPAAEPTVQAVRVEQPVVRTPARRTPVRRVYTPRRRRSTNLEPRIEPPSQDPEINRHTASSYEYHETSFTPESSYEDDIELRDANVSIVDHIKTVLIQMYDPNVTMIQRAVPHEIETAASITFAPGALQPARDDSELKRTVGELSRMELPDSLVQMENMITIDPDVPEKTLGQLENMRSFEPLDVPEMSRLDEIGPPAARNQEKHRIHTSTPVRTKKDPNRVKKLLRLLQEIFEVDDSITFNNLCERINEFVTRPVAAVTFGDLLCLQRDRYIELVPKRNSLELDLIAPGQRLMNVIHE